MIKRIGLLSGLGIILVSIISQIDFDKSIAEMPPEDELYLSYTEKKAETQRAGLKKLQITEEFARINQQMRTPDDLVAPSYSGNYRIKEYTKKARRNKSNNITFTERGPANVAGRTRAVLAFPSDLSLNTWLIGSVSGGIWKTTDGGGNWENMTADLPNLGFSTLAHSAANENIIYAGTGEHFTNDIDGAGMFKSEDGGESWQQIVSPEQFPDFRNVSRIVVDHNDPNIVVATTRNSLWARVVDDEGLLDTDLNAAIYKSSDGGSTWRRTLSSSEDRYDHIVADPADFNNLYVAINGVRVIKSTDAGETWEDASRGLNAGGRAEIAISPVNPQRLFLSTQGSLTGTGSDLYVSTDGAESWQVASTPNADDNIHFLDGQGWFDNTIIAHPHDEEIVYVGGVNLFKFTITEGVISTTTFEVVEDGTEGFLDLINFGGSIGGGGINLGNVLTQDEINPIEIRFGQGSQMAHRFTVDGRGSRVPDSDFRYEDLVEVPFQVWDTELDRQLMVSFRDQQNDGVWNLIETFAGTPTTENSREYIYIHDVQYTETTDPNIAQTGGGHVYRNMYFIWPVLTDDSEFQDNNFPVSNFRIDKNEVNALEKTIEVMSDAYNDFDGRNTFVQSNRTASGVHPDQHNIFILNDSPANRQFRLLVANDGGMYVSRVSRDPGVLNGSWSYASLGNNTSQFYNADKAPGTDRYIGGMQDNGTWFTPSSAGADATTSYRFALGGDGFESIWNNRDDNLIIAGSQFNNFSRTINGGGAWRNATQGIDDQGPFWSQLENSKALPDRIFTVGSSGVWKSNNFGELWEPTRINDDRWSFTNFMSIEVSIANPDVIWAGGALAEDRRFFVSTDGGNSFSATEFYTEAVLGNASGLSTHPTESETAFAMFSFQGRPKILRTNDLGQTWEDITGFANSQNGTSSRGFPDVAVNKVFVFPNDIDRIWAGTEIGIVESLDGGSSWEIMDNDMGAVNIYDMILQDDQIVIATYGRGIWTASVEGLEQEFIFPPIISSSSLSPLGEINLEVEYSEVFDSSVVAINDQTILQLDSNDEGITNMVVDNPQISGLAEIVVIGYLEGIAYPSISIDLQLFIPLEPVEEYSNDFADESRNSEFMGNGFSIYTEDNFNDPAIHSPHPYPDDTALIYTLVQPIRILEQQFLTFDNIALVEPGDPGSVFGDNNFWDFVIVESSSDGETWAPFGDGYDARGSELWLNAFRANAQPRSFMFSRETIDLSQFHDKDDVILIRFRLFADQAVNGWGWAIDNVNVVLDNTTATIDVENTENKIYPTLTTGVVNVEIDTRMNINSIAVYDLNGRLIMGDNITGLDRYQFNISDQSSGYYIVELANEEDNVLQRIIKQ
jgi:photosystem II stability/assembly factor-like uncharacterized protein